jgi:flagellar biosynthesis protein FlhG
MNDQAQSLRDLMRRKDSVGRVIAVTSGKGGVGKTNTSINLAIAIARYGKRVVVVDADLGLANVEVLLGITSLYNLEHVIEGERRLKDILVQGPGGIHIIPGSSGLAKLADLPPQGRELLLNEMKTLQESTDFIIVDTMAGIGRNAVAFALAADEVILVTTPEPSAIVDAYAMFKTLCHQRRDVFIRLIVNMAGTQTQADAVANKLSNVAQQYMGRSLSYLGMLPRDPHVSQAVMQSRPYLLLYPHAPVSEQTQALAARLLHQPVAEPKRDGFLRRFAQNLGLVSSG